MKCKKYYSKINVKCYFTAEREHSNELLFLLEINNALVQLVLLSSPTDLKTNNQTKRKNK